MLGSEFAEQSEVLYNALITSHAVSVLADYRHSGELPQDAQDNLRKCYNLMKRISRAQVLVQTQTEKIVPDLDSIQVYHYTQEALIPRGILEAGETVGQAAEEFARTLQKILAGKAPAEIDERDLARLEKAIGALSSVYTSKTAVSSLSSHFKASFSGLGGERG